MSTFFDVAPDPDDRAIDTLQIQFRDRLSQHKAGLRNLVDKIGELTNAVQELEML